MQGKKVVIGLAIFGAVVSLGLNLARPASWSDELRLRQNDTHVSIAVAPPVSKKEETALAASKDDESAARAMKLTQVDVIYRFVDPAEIDSKEGFEVVQSFTIAREPDDETKPEFDKKNTLEKEIPVPEGAVGKLLEVRMIYRVDPKEHPADARILARKSLTIR